MPHLTGAHGSRKRLTMLLPVRRLLPCRSAEVPTATEAADTIDTANTIDTAAVLILPRCSYCRSADSA